MFDTGYQADRRRNTLHTVIAIVLMIGIVASTSIAVIEYEQIAYLQSELDNLQEQYDTLQAQYSSLFADHEALKAAFEDPLSHPTTPTISQVRNWLPTDSTDENTYVDGVWTCGDFAAMLMTRAKEMNWRIRIAVIFYSFEGESGYGNIGDVYGSHGHAFNVIECTDGIWYIEPQSDATWYLVRSGTNDRTEFYLHWYYNFEDSTRGTIWDGYSFFVNFYSQFA